MCQLNICTCTKCTKSFCVLTVTIFIAPFAFATNAMINYLFSHRARANIQSFKFAAKKNVWTYLVGFEKSSSSTFLLHRKLFYKFAWQEFSNCFQSNFKALENICCLNETHELHWLSNLWIFHKLDFERQLKRRIRKINCSCISRMKRIEQFHWLIDLVRKTCVYIRLTSLSSHIGRLWFWIHILWSHFNFFCSIAYRNWNLICANDRFLSLHHFDFVLRASQEIGHTFDEWCSSTQIIAQYAISIRISISW